MNIALAEPYYSGSHKQWCDGLMDFSTHNWKLFSLRGKYWKWRMKGGAVAIAEMFENEPVPDAFLVSDMLDLAVFKSLLPPHFRKTDIPFVLYFHENQLMYPWNTDDGREEERDRHYAFTNYTSALAADAVWFSSTWQMKGFLEALEVFLKAFPDHRGLGNINEIAGKSIVVPVGLGPFPELKPYLKGRHTLLWNHRHEHDKNPELFFEVLFELSSEGADFDLIVLGEDFSQSPPVFSLAREKLAGHIVQWGAVDRSDYFTWLQKATIAPVTSNHDFFGMSVLEGAAMGALAVLPDKLVYPEHFSGTEARFYKYPNELLSCLREELNRPWQLHKSLVDAGRRYEWTHIVHLYDNLLSQLKA